MAEAAKKKTTTKLKKWPRLAKAAGKKTCSVANCKRPYRAKSYCFFHYKKWRQGELPHSRYRICSKPECRKKVLKAGMCEQHHGEWKKGATPEAAAPAAAEAKPAA